jgi:hypothetical protein
MEGQELLHYGVKGMKWGVRRSENASRPSKYKQSHRETDQAYYGKGGARRIAKRVNKKGKSLKEARRLEDRRENIKAGIAAGAFAASLALTQYGKVKAAAANKRNQQAADRLADMFGPKGIASEPAPINYAKRSRKGVYNISSL